MGWLTGGDTDSTSNAYQQTVQDAGTAGVTTGSSNDIGIDGDSNRGSFSGNDGQLFYGGTDNNNQGVLNRGSMSGNAGLIFSGGQDAANSGVIVRGSNNTVTDLGAVKAAFAFGDHALDVTGDLSTQALSNADKQVGQAIGAVSAQSSTVANFMRDATNKIGELAKSFQSQGQSDQQKIYLYGALAGFVGIVAVAYLMTRGKK